jgi:hypothetical protein
VHLQVVDREDDHQFVEDSHQIWRIAVNIVNKHSQPGKIGWSFSLGNYAGGKQLLTIKTTMLQYVIWGVGQVLFGMT